jgi:hypothetical protein
MWKESTKITRRRKKRQCPVYKHKKFKVGCLDIYLPIGLSMFLHFANLLEAGGGQRLWKKNKKLTLKSKIINIAKGCVVVRY